MKKLDKLCCGEKWFCSTRGWNGWVEKWKKPVRGSGKMSNMKKVSTLSHFQTTFQMLRNVFKSDQDSVQARGGD